MLSTTLAEGPNNLGLGYQSEDVYGPQVIR